MKRIIFIFCGLCWLGFALAVGLLFWPYLAGGALGDLGISQILAGVTSGGILLGLVHLAGFIALILTSFGIGLSLLLHGLHPKPQSKPNPDRKEA